MAVPKLQHIRPAERVVIDAQDLQRIAVEAVGPCQVSAKNPMAFVQAWCDDQNALRGLIPQGFCRSPPPRREKTGGWESTEHPKFARTAEVFCCLLTLFGSGSAGLGGTSKNSDLREFVRV
jgi:hypothetical protein